MRDFIFTYGTILPNDLICIAEYQLVHFTTEQLRLWRALKSGVNYLLIVRNWIFILLLMILRWENTLNGRAHASLLIGIVLMTGSNLSEEDAEVDMYSSGVSTTIYNLKGTPYSARGDWYHSFINLLLQMMFLQNCDSFVVGHTTVDAIIRTTDFYYCPLHNSNFHFLILFS